MKRARALRLTLALAATLALSCAVYYYGRSRFIPLAVALFRSATGLDVNFRDVRFKFGLHPAIRIDHGELISHNHRLLSFKRLTVFYSYHALFHSRGLPLTSLVIDAPRVRVLPSFGAPAALAGSGPTGPPNASASSPVSSSLPSKAAMPRATAPQPALPARQTPYNAFARGESYAERFIKLETQASEEVARALSALGNVAPELEVEDGIVLGADDKSLVEDLTFKIQRESPTSESWETKFDLVLAVGPVTGARIAGDGKLSPKGRAHHAWAQGKVRFSRDTPTQLAFKDIEGQTGGLQANLTIVLGDEGHAAGVISLKLAQAVISSPMLKRPIAAANYFFSSSVAFSADSLRVEQASLKRDSDPLLQGEATLTGLASSAPRLTLKTEWLTMDLAQAKLWLARIKAPPRAAQQLAGYVQSGRFTLRQAELDVQIGGPEQLKTQELLKGLRLAGNVNQVNASLPSDLQLPTLNAFQARFLLEKSRLTVSQIQARLGNSTLSAGSLEADLMPAAGQARFVSRCDLSLALGELYKAAVAGGGDAARITEKYLRAVDGAASVTANAQGRIGPAFKLVLGSYAISVHPQQVALALRTLPRTVKVASGEVSIVPGLLTVKRLEVADGRSTALIDGSSKLDGRRPSLHRLVVDFHHIELNHWLALAVKPKEATATAVVDGRVSILGTPGLDSDFSAHGRLAASPASVKLGILRSPIDAKTIVIELHGRGGVMRAEDAEFEGEKANVEVSVPDVTRPVAQINVNVARLDLHSLKFVHFPGQLKPRPKFFSPDTRIFGHVKMDKVHVDRLNFSGVTLDFDRRGNNWTVSNIAGTAYGGHAAVNLKGRSEDDIVYVTTQVKDIDVNWFLTALDPSSKPVLSGRLNGEGKFRADTNDDFKQTLDGKGAFKIRNGTAYRLKLLARVLSLMSVSGLLRGRLPDPFVEGVPFRVLKADLTSEDGLLHTNDLVLDGPVLRMSAVGYVDLPANKLDLTVGVMPFNMIDSALSLLPVVGNNLGGSEGLLAIYVTANGPLGDPTVLPAPLTSVTKILKKILTLPVSVINSEF